MTIEALITVHVTIEDSDDEEHEAEQAAMAALDALASDALKMGDMTCSETLAISVDD